MKPGYTPVTLVTSPTCAGTVRSGARPIRSARGHGRVASRVRTVPPDAGCSRCAGWRCGQAGPGRSAFRRTAAAGPAGPGRGWSCVLDCGEPGVGGDAIGPLLDDLGVHGAAVAASPADQIVLMRGTAMPSRDARTGGVRLVRCIPGAARAPQLGDGRAVSVRRLSGRWARGLSKPGCRRPSILSPGARRGGRWTAGKRVTGAAGQAGPLPLATREARPGCFARPCGRRLSGLARAS